MEILSDEMLVDSYDLATELGLEPEFISMLLAEIKRRDIAPDEYRIGA